MSENLRNVLKSIQHFGEEELAETVACFKPRAVTKNTILLHQGDICRHFYFVRSGCIRMFFIDKSGHEKTRYVMFDHHIGTALNSFITQQPSFECIEALEDTQLLAIRHNDFYRLTKKLDNWNSFYLRILEMAYCFQNKKIEQLVTLSAKQRYESVLQEHPELFQRLSNRVLSTYLDIREETLSRLKSPVKKILT